VAWIEWRQPKGDVTQIVTSSKTNQRDVDHIAPAIDVSGWRSATPSTLRLSPRRPLAFATASGKVWKEQHIDDAPVVAQPHVRGSRDTGHPDH
jgi:hypothetical protein